MTNEYKTPIDDTCWCTKCHTANPSHYEKCIECSSTLEPTIVTIPEAMVKHIQADAVSDNLLIQKLDTSTPGLFVIKMDLKNQTREILEFFLKSFEGEINRYAPGSRVMIVPDSVKSLSSREAPEVIAQKFIDGFKQCGAPGAGGGLTNLFSEELELNLVAGIAGLIETERQ